MKRFTALLLICALFFGSAFAASKETAASFVKLLFESQDSPFLETCHYDFENDVFYIVMRHNSSYLKLLSLDSEQLSEIFMLYNQLDDFFCTYLTEAGITSISVVLSTDGRVIDFFVNGTRQTSLFRGKMLNEHNDSDSRDMIIASVVDYWNESIVPQVPGVGNSVYDPDSDFIYRRLEFEADSAHLNYVLGDLERAELHAAYLEYDRLFVEPFVENGVYVDVISAALTSDGYPFFLSVNGVDQSWVYKGKHGDPE